MWAVSVTGERAPSIEGWNDEEAHTPQVLSLRIREQEAPCRFFVFVFVFVLLGLYLWHVEVPRLGV